MKLTRVEAASMQEALWKIRTTLGDEATIVGTRTFRRGGVLGVGGKEVVEVYVADPSKSHTSNPAMVAASQGQGLGPTEAIQGRLPQLNKEVHAEVESFT